MFKEYFQRNKKVRFRAQKLITLCTFCNNEGTVFIFLEWKKGCGGDYYCFKELGKGNVYTSPRAGIALHVSFTKDLMIFHFLLIKTSNGF